MRPNKKRKSATRAGNDNVLGNGKHSNVAKWRTVARSPVSDASLSDPLASARRLQSEATRYLHILRGHRTFQPQLSCWKDNKPRNKPGIEKHVVKFQR